MLLLLLEKGKVPSNLNQFFRYAIPASIIEELRILRRIRIESEGKKASIVLIDDTPTNKAILDGILSEIIYYFQETSEPLNLVKYLGSLGNKKRKWQEQLWTDLENKGIIQNKKDKYFLIQSETKEKLQMEIKNILGKKAQPDELQKAIIGFFKHTRQLRFISKKSDRDKEWVNSFTEDCLIPKIFARNVLMPAATKRAVKGTSIMQGLADQVTSASSQFSSSVSGTSQDFKDVRSIGSINQKTWGGIQAEKTLRQDSSVSSSGGSPGDLIVKGIKKVKEKKFDKKDETEEEM